MRYWQSDEPKPRTPRRRKAPPRPKSSVAAGGSLRNYPFLRRFYQHQASISTGFQKFLFFLVMATLLYTFVFGDAGAIRLFTLHKEKVKLEGHIVLLELNLAALQAEIDALQNDAFKMEKLGRERYDYIYHGDRVYKIIRPNSK